METRPHSIRERKAYESYYYRKNRERILARKKEWKKSNPEKLRATNAKRNGKPRKIWYVAKRRAESTGVPFNLDPSDIVVPTHCPVLGMKLVCGVGKISPASPTLDRLNPALGYVKGNVAVISYKANAIKSNATADEISKVAEWLRRQM